MTISGAGEAAAVGLRERSKAKRHIALQRTAMQLFAERGYDNTTIADIAAAAEVAPRTVSGYFASKVDLATSFADDVAARLVATIAAHPGADIVTVLDVWLTGEAELSDTELTALAHAMYVANPELGALSSAHVAEAVEVSGAALADYIGLPADHPMVRIGGAALGGTLSAYLDGMADGRPTDELHQSVMTYLRALLDAAKPTERSSRADT